MMTLPSITSFGKAGFKANKAKDVIARRARKSLKINRFLPEVFHSFQENAKIKKSQQVNTGQNQELFKNVRDSVIQLQFF